MKPSEAIVERSPDLLELLKTELTARCRSNPKYSLRAFARSLRLESSHLSKILQGKRPLTTELVKRIAKPLGLAQSQFDRYLADAERQRGKRKSRNQNKVIPLDNFHNLKLDQFHLISNWYHYAILELVSVNGFKPDAKWIAAKLDIPLPVVRAALARLLRLKLLVKIKGNYLISTGNNTTVESRFTAVAFRQLQRDVLQKALKALDELPMEVRDQSSVTLATDSALLPEARERVKNFRRELSAFLQRTTKRDTVYHLGISLYPVTKGDV